MSLDNHVTMDDDDDVLNLGVMPHASSGTHTVVPVCLIGRLCAEKAPNMFALIEVMTKAFHPKAKMTTREWSKGLVIHNRVEHFENPDDIAWVIHIQP
ncbi:hypothetical protein ACS0TY_005724 [Phlomoides rotata]